MGRRSQHSRKGCHLRLESASIAKSRKLWARSYSDSSECECGGKREGESECATHKAHGALFHAGEGPLGWLRISGEERRRAVRAAPDLVPTTDLYLVADLVVVVGGGHGARARHSAAGLGRVDGRGVHRLSVELDEALSFEGVRLPGPVQVLDLLSSLQIRKFLARVVRVVEGSSAQPAGHRCHGLDLLAVELLCVRSLEVLDGASDSLPRLCHRLCALVLERCVHPDDAVFGDGAEPVFEDKVRLKGDQISARCTFRHGIDRRRQGEVVGSNRDFFGCFNLQLSLDLDFGFLVVVGMLDVESELVLTLTACVVVLPG